MATEKKKYIITGTNRAHILNAIGALEVGDEVRVSGPTRNLPQNAALWSLLGEISRQVDWYGQKLSDEEWKAVFSASLKKQKVVPGLDGGFVICGQSTSKMTKADFSELLELANAFAAQHNVKLSTGAM